MKKLTTEEFIEKAIKVHGNKYDYSKVDYINSTTKVCIICPIHGEFWQKASDHINNNASCPKCASIHVQEKQASSNIQFIEKARNMIIPK